MRFARPTPPINWLPRSRLILPATHHQIKIGQAVCPAGKVVLGTGARVSVATGGQAVLQISRASGSGNLAVGPSRADHGGYPGIWGLATYAICAKKPAGYEVCSRGARLP